MEKRIYIQTLGIIKGGRHRNRDVSLISDVIEAISSHRPYRPVVGMGKALQEISKNKGALYDPNIADVVLKLFYEKGFKFG